MKQYENTLGQAIFALLIQVVRHLSVLMLILQRL